MSDGSRRPKDLVGNAVHGCRIAVGEIAKAAANARWDKLKRIAG